MAALNREELMDATAMYEHDRYFIGHPSEGGPWEVGDRKNGCDQVAECTSKAKAVRVWRALIAADDKDAASTGLAELENADLREGLAHNELAYGELELELGRVRQELGGLQDLVDDLHQARNNGGKVPTRPIEVAPSRKRKARA
jgi:hypothetical protein